MNLIFCSEPFNNKNVDPDWQLEYEIAIASGLAVHLLNYEALRDEDDISNALKRVIPPKTKELCIYRGWMMPVACYKKLYDGLLAKNLQLINSPEEYQHCYYLPESYSVIAELTPRSISMDKEQIRSVGNLETALSNFGNKPIIVKDYVKSQKHHWFEACFIPDASNFKQAEKVIKKFIELQGDNLEGGLVLREFVELESIGIHPKSKMPLAMEYRIFILNGQPISIIKYWDEGLYPSLELPISDFSAIFKQIRSHFYTVDIAKQKNGFWIIVELGDAQVAEHMNSFGLQEFYRQLAVLKEIG